ncbi:MAG TPA: alpha/beta hydrolase [Gemmatimonadales bacterium]|nr:alpha/beta hydrolase [Gemmatimonadales bacterium]
MLFVLSLLLTLDSAVVHTVTTAPAESLRVTITGTGEPVVIVPGLSASAFAYRKVIPPLAQEGLQVIVIEPLGVGHSSRPSKANYSLTSQADRIAAVMDSLQLPPTLIVAHSVAVSMALRLAVRRPDRVAQILAVDGGPDEKLATAGVKKAVKFGFLLKLFAGRGRIRSEVRKAMVSSSVDTTWITREVIDGYTEGSAGDVGAILKVLKGMVNAVEPDSITPHLGEITVPVRLLIGTGPHDSGVSPKGIRAMQSRIPDFAIDSVPNCGLNIHEEKPEAMVDVILKLMGKRDGERTGG